MCGITAYLGKTPGAKYVLEGIKMLRNRGYDSMGCASLKFSSSSGKHHMIVTKYADKPGQNSFELLETNFRIHEGARCLIAHSRWATTGRVNDPNSHPHVDTVFPDKISLVHNGIISNHDELKSYLIDQGVEFRTETDTEVIVNLMGYYYQRSGHMMDAVKLTIKDLEGTWALVIMNVDEPNTLYVCKNGSPVLLGYSEDMCIVSSEVSGFSNYLKRYHSVKDHQIIKIYYNENIEEIEFYRDDRLMVLSSQSVMHQSLQATSPSPYPYWTIKEIMEQKDAATRALNQGGRLYNDREVKLGGLKGQQNELLKIRHLVILASGTSMHAALLGQKHMQSISGFETVRVIDAAEFSLTDLTTSHDAKTGVLVISQSGETRDVIRCMEMLREGRPDVMIFSIVNVPESLIARETGCGIYLNAGREVGVASTKSFTNQVIVLMLLTIWFAQNRGLCEIMRMKMISSLHNVGNLIETTLGETLMSCHEAVTYLKKWKHLFILGSGMGLPIAMEGALKIKELSYIHAEAYASGSLKHGPLALIEGGTPIIVLRLGDVSKMDIAAAETKSRGAYLIQIGSHKCAQKDLYDMEIVIPTDGGIIEPLLSVIPLQYLAYLLAIELGYNPDYPRNLAKVITV